MPVYYGGNDVIPAPLAQITQDLQRSEDGRVRRRSFSIALRGTLLPGKGSPRSDGSWWNLGSSSPPPDEAVPHDSRLAALRGKQAALASAFSVDGLALEVQPLDGSQPIKCYPRVRSLEFAEGPWVDRCNYAIQLEADSLWLGGVELGGTAGIGPEESWTVESEQGDLRAYRVSHSASSQQRDVLGEGGVVLKKGWEAARDLVLPRVGLLPSTGLLPPIAQSHLPCNYARSQTIDESSGRFAVTESWVYTANLRAVEEFSVSTRVQDGRVRVTVDGTVTGYAAHDPAMSGADLIEAKFQSARDAYNDEVFPLLLGRAQAFSGRTLNPTPITQTVGSNATRGVVSYNAEFDDRRIGLVAGSISEALSVQDQNPADVFAQIVVLGRTQGPVLQSIGTRTAATRQVAFEAVLPPWSYGEAMPAKPDTSALFQSLDPGGFRSRDDESWSPDSGRYSRSVSWTF